jgi:hypothetical protein
MEMVKYLALAAVIVGSLAVADIAEARGRRGCSTCNSGGGCPGGVCAVQYAPGPMPVAPMKAAEVAPAAPVVAAAPAAPTYYTTNARRGLFGRRR